MMTNNIKYCSYLIIIVKYNKNQSFSANLRLLYGPFNHELCVLCRHFLSYYIYSYYFYRGTRDLSYKQIKNVLNI